MSAHLSSHGMMDVYYYYSPSPSDFPSEDFIYLAFERR